MGALCTFNDKKNLQREKNIREVEKHWNSFNSITKTIGKANEALSQESINIIAENLFSGRGLSMQADLSKGEVSRLKLYIEDLDSRIRRGNMGSLYLNVAVGESISMKHPLARSFYEGINESIGFERNYHDRAMYDITNVGSDLTNALIEYATPEFRKELRKVQGEYFAESAKSSGNGDPAMKAIMLKLKQLENSRGNDVFKDFHELVTMDKNSFKTNKNKYDVNIRNAAGTARKLLDDLGTKVAMPGLDNLYKAAVRKVHGGKMPKLVDRDLQAFKDKVDAAKKRIEDAVKAGGYFPHVMLENILKMNNSLQNRVLSAKNSNEARAAISGENGLAYMVDAVMPDNLKAATPFGEQIWNMDPIQTLERYATDVIAFNKVNSVAEHYLRVIPAFKDSKIDSKFLEGMHDFMNDQFRMETKGFTERPEWVNTAMRNILSAYTLKTMGLSPTGAIRNFLSATYFVSGVGAYNTMKSLAAYKSRKTFAGDEQNVKQILDKIEEEQGFHFSDTETFNEMIADGILSASAERKSIVYDPVNDRINYVDHGVKKSLEDVMKKMTTKSLFMHRWGENLTRTSFFRSAFISAYETLSKTDMDMQQRQLRSKRFALRLVNQFAFEYAPHSKSRFVGGRPASGPIDPLTGKATMTATDSMAAGGQLMFQFMHFPMSFLQNQARILGGAVNGLRAKQIDAPEYMQLVNFASIGLMTQALSIAFNADINNVLENDTIERAKMLAEYLTDDPDTVGKKRGIASLVSGPVPSDLLWAMQVSSLNNSDPGYMQRLLLGDVDYSADDNLINSRRYKLGTMYGLWANKLKPAISSGNGWEGLTRHIMSAYPRDWTRKYNRQLMNWLGWRKHSTYNKNTRQGDRTLRKLQTLNLDLDKGIFG